MGNYRDYSNYGPMVINPDMYALGHFEYYRNPELDETKQIIMSFEDFLYRHIDENWKSRLRYKFYTNSMPIGRIRHNVKNPTEYWMTDCDIKKITYTRVDQFSVIVDVIIIADLEVYGEKEIDTAQQWYRVRIMTDFREADYKQGEIISVYDAKENYDGIPMSEHLVPYLTAEQMEREVIDLLNIYYKEALDNICKPDMYLLAERMGYTIEYARLSPNGVGEKGKTVFCDTEMVLYDQYGNEYVEFVKGKTILIDKQANLVYGHDTTEETIAHECIHIYEHHAFFGLQKMYADELGFVGLDINTLMYDNRSSEPVQWVECQARAMTLRLMMPIKSVAQKYNEFLDKNKKRTADFLQMQEYTLYDIADYFGVTKHAAKKRLLSLGLKFVRGILVYCDGKYIPNHMWAANTDYNTTYTIDRYSLAALCEADTMLKTILELEMFVYVEGHVCINEERFVKKVNGSYTLTKLGRYSIDSCCLAFERKYESAEYEYQYGALSRIDKRGMTTFVLGKDAISNVYDEAEIMQDIPRGLPEEFLETLEEHIEKSGYSVKDLADTTYLNSERIKNIRKGKVKFVSLEEVVALGIGLGLQPEEIYDLVDKSTDKKRNTFRHNAIYVLVRKYYLYTIDTINQALIALNEEPLTVPV